MSHAGRTQLFDRWAETYDATLAPTLFPFDGYDRVLDQDEAGAAYARAGLQVTYRQVSSCGGVFTFMGSGH
jgi:hypothetical protein